MVPRCGRGTVAEAVVTDYVKQVKRAGLASPPGPLSTMWRGGVDSRASGSDEGEAGMAGYARVS